MPIDKGRETGGNDQPDDWQKIETERAQRDALSRKHDELHDPSPEFEKAARPLPPEYGSHRPKHLELTPEQVAEIEEFTGKPIEHVLAVRDTDPRAGHNRDEQGRILDPHGNPRETPDPHRIESDEHAQHRPQEQLEQAAADSAGAAEHGNPAADRPRPPNVADPSAVLSEVAEQLRSGQLTPDQAADRLEAFSTGSAPVGDNLDSAGRDRRRVGETDAALDSQEGDVDDLHSGSYDGVDRPTVVDRERGSSDAEAAAATQPLAREVPDDRKSAAGPFDRDLVGQASAELGATSGAMDQGEAGASVDDSRSSMTPDDGDSASARDAVGEGFLSGRLAPEEAGNETMADRDRQRSMIDEPVVEARSPDTTEAAPDRLDNNHNEDSQDEGEPTKPGSGPSMERLTVLDTRFQQLEAEYEEDFEELAQDPDHKGVIEPSARDEARVALDLRALGKLPADIQRPSGPKQGDLYSPSTGEFYDIKGVHSDWPPITTQRDTSRPFKNAYDPENNQRWVNKLEEQINDYGRIVILDMRNANQAAIEDVQNIVADKDWSDRVVWYP